MVCRLERSLPARLRELPGRIHRAGVRPLAGIDSAWHEVGIRPGLHLHRESGKINQTGLDTIGEKVYPDFSDPSCRADNSPELEVLLHTLRLDG